MPTTWFAQNSSVNIDSVNEWNDAANGSGNWLTWANLASDDVLCANAKTAILINCDFACARISTAAEVPIQGGANGAAGGGFTFSGTTSRTITADLLAGSSICLVTSHTSGTLTIIAPEGSTYVITSVGFNAYGLQHTSAGSIDITGNIAGSSVYGYGAYISGTGAVTINGNVSGGSGGNSWGILNSGSAVVTLNGNAYGGTADDSIGICNSWNGTVIVNGDVTGGTGIGSRGVDNRYIAFSIITGNIINNIEPGVSGRYRYDPAPGKYIQCPYDGTPGHDYKYPKQLAAANVKSGVVHGDITGTYEGEAGAAGAGPLVGLGGLVS